MLALWFAAMLVQAVSPGAVLSRPANSVPYCWRGKTLVREVAPCDDADVRWMLETSGAPSADDLAASGMSGIRVLRYDGFSNMEPMITYVTGTSGGYLEARAVGRDGVVATLRRHSWDAADHAISGFIDRTGTEPAPLPPVPAGAPPPRPCTDEPVVIVEVIAEGRVTRRRPRVCDGQPTSTYWNELAAFAVEAFPKCGGLKSGRFSWPLRDLDLCLLVDGPNEEAAIEVVNGLQLMSANQTRRPFDAESLADDVVLVRADGERLVGRDAVRPAVTERHHGMLQVSRVRGDSDMVVVWAGGWGIPRSIQLNWRKLADGKWRIVEWAESRD